MAGLFDALSTTYDGVGVDFFAPIGASLLRALPPRSGERWLDVGCGRGAVLLPAAAAIGPAGRAVGTDISAAMVASTLERAAAAGWGNVEARVDDAQTSALEPASFDTLSSSLVLFFLADPAAALAGWSRLLVPGGRLGVTSFNLVIYTPPNRDSICFEPYTCVTDAINLEAQGVASGWQVLAPGASFRSWIDIEAGLVVA